MKKQWRTYALGGSPSFRQPAPARLGWFPPGFDRNREVPSERFQADVPKRMFPSERFRAKAPKRKSPNDSQVKVLKVKFPNDSYNAEYPCESFQAKLIKRKFPNERYQAKVPKLKFPS